MAQPADKKGGFKHYFFLRFRITGTTDLLGGMEREIPWGLIAKNDTDLDDFNFAATLTSTQIFALAGDVNAKNWTESERNFKNFYLCTGDEAMQPVFDIKTERSIGPHGTCV